MTRSTGIHISHYCHMSLNKHTYHTTYICSTALLLHLHIEPTLVHRSVNNRKMQVLFHKLFLYMYQQQICPSNAEIFKIWKLFDVHQWRKKANKYVKYQLTGINHVTRSSKLSLNVMPAMITMTLTMAIKPNCIR